MSTDKDVNAPTPEQELAVMNEAYGELFDQFAAFEDEVMACQNLDDFMMIKVRLELEREDDNAASRAALSRAIKIIRASAEGGQP